MHPKQQLRNEAVVSAPGILQLSTPAGAVKELLVGKPTKADQVTLTKWAKSKFNPMAHLAKLTAAEKSEYIRAAAMAGAGVEKQMSFDDLEAILLSPAGVAQTIWLSAKRYNPGITLAEIQACVTEENFLEVQCAFDDATTTPWPEGATDEQKKRWEGDPATGLPFSPGGNG